jgi:hypothetical protein
MQETLYKTQTPEKDDSEYYEMVILSVPEIQPRRYKFTVMHGWWDEANKQSRATTETICPEDGLSYEEAEEMYNKQKEYLTRQGFIYSFSVNPFA